MSPRTPERGVWRPAGLRRLVVAGALATLGCSVEPLELSGGPVTRNECNETRDCAEGRCVSGQCRAVSGAIEALLFEITPPGDATSIAGTRFVEPVAPIDPLGGELSLELGHVSLVSGVVNAPSEALAGCPANEGEGMAPSADGSLPGRITLAPRSRQLGIASESYAMDAELSDEGYRFTRAVPPGRYDVYVEPRGVIGKCTQPPHLFLDRVVGAGDVDLRLNLALPQQLHVVVRWPHQDVLLEGWMLDVVERDTGRLVSTRSVLSKPALTTDGLEYAADLAYVPVSPAGTGLELVRLSPPPGVAAPQIIIDRSVVELFQEGQGIIDQFLSLPQPVQVMGQVSVENSTHTVAATVSLVATELRMISSGTVAAFERVVESDPGGQFTVDLLPGTYRVVAVPAAGSGLSPTEAVWQISANQDVQAGRVVELASTSEVSARVLGPGRGVVAGAAVQAAASAPSSNVGVLDRALGLTGYTPRAEGTVTDADGRFLMGADRGLFDLWVRPGASSGFAWLVLPGVDAKGPAAPLGDVRMPLPVHYSGTLSSADLAAGVSSALIRAYAYLDGNQLTNDPERATAVIQVAESRVDADGTFELLVPASLGLP